MGKKDTVTKEYMKDCEVFADVFNFLIYEGRAVIRPEELRSLDAAQTMAVRIADGKELSVQRSRDVMKCLAAKTDGNTVYLILGIENQSEVHYAMPVRNMLYDALQYASQVEETAREHRRAGKTKGRSQGEFLSGFYKEDRLTPVVTLVVCFNAEKWDGPLSLHDMLTGCDRELLPYVENYRIHLIEPFSVSEEKVKLFRSSMREVVSFLKYSKDKGKMRDLIKGNDRYRALNNNAVRVIKECTGAEIRIEEDEEVTDVCKAWEDMKKEYYDEGMAAGEAKGEAIGRAEGRAVGEDRINSLNRRLIADNRQADLIRSVSDGGFQQELLRQYNI